jgi:hypothetical protein
VWQKIGRKSKSKQNSTRFSLNIYRTTICDLCLKVHAPGKKGEALKIYHNDFDCQVRACFYCRVSYFKSFLEDLYHQFENAWFTSTDLKKVLKLSPKAISNIKKTKTAPHPNYRSN